MSTDTAPTDDTRISEMEADQAAYEVIEEHRELFERLADTDLPISHRAQKALQFADEFEEEHDVE